MATRPSSGRHHKVVAVLVLGLLALAGLILWAARRETAAEKRIHQLLAELRASGAPVSAADLARLFPDPPPEQDAGIIYGPAFNLATNASFRGNAPFISGRDLPLRGTNMDEEMRLAARQFCLGTTGLIAALPASIPPDTRFPSHWERGFQNSSAVSFVAVRKLIQALAIHAVDAAEARDAGAAAKTLQHAFTFTRTINYEQSLVSHMIHHACGDLAVVATARALNRVPFTDEQLQAIARSMETEAQDSLTNLWNTERSMGIWVFQSVKDGMSIDSLLHPKDPTPLLTRLWVRIKQRKREYSDEDFLRYLELIPRHLEALQQPALVAEARCGALQQEYYRLQTSEIGDAILPNMRLYVSRRAASQASRASLRTALAIERFRLAHQGALPETIPELVPAYLEAVPIDPFDGQPLRYRKMERGYVVYSIGPHGVDAGGRERTGQNQMTNYNVGIVIER